MAHPYHIYSGSIYCEATGDIIESPAILVDTQTGTVHGTGESDYLTKKYNEMYSKLTSAGFNDMASALVLLTLGGPKTGMTREMQCYVLNRCLEYGHSHFPAEMCRHGMDGTGIKYIKSEMERMPIDCGWKEDT